MSDEQLDPDVPVADRVEEYESPVIFDLGSVFEVTKGSSGGNADENGQRQH